jgi:two-component system, NtrC family, nitrogen regulation response regulator NtrX
MAETHRVLVVDDEASIRSSLRMVLEFEGYEVEELGAGAAVLSRVNDRPPDAILLDIKMPDMDGLEVLTRLRERGFELPVLVISGHADVNTAVEATRLGAFDFLEKPLQRERVVVSLRNAIESHRLERENQSLRSEADHLVGDTQPMRELRDRIARAAPTPATVLIVGESGTGKELVARAIHEGSPRRQRPLVQVNCAAIPEELIESELFGHEKGSFTGAVRKQIGKFLAAHGGTIFLDEIGDMSARTQAKVLRVLQSGEIEPVGAAAVIRVDVRVVAATNRDLEKDIAEGRFREDLFYRLNVVPIRTPPLRERLDDIEPLVTYFVERFARESNYPRRSFSPQVLERLRAMPWRGNVRELRNLVERLLILSRGDVIDSEDLALIGGESPGDGLGGLLGTETLREFQEQSEKLFISHKLDQFSWNITQTAQAIQTPRSNLYKKLEQYGLKRADD